MLIKNVTIFDKGEKEIDIRVKNSIVKTLDKDITPYEGEKVLDAKGLYLLPSIVDLNLSIKNSSFNLKNLKTLSEDAKSGGVGSFVLNSDFNPPLENKTELELLKSNLKEKSDTNLIISIPAINKKNRLNDISSLIKGGAEIIEFKSEIESNLVKRVMQYSKLKHSPLFCYSQNSSLDEDGVMNDGEISFKLGLGGISKISEISEVSKIVQMAIEFDAKIIFKTISTGKSLKIINQAKKENRNIFSEVSINNLVLNENECDTFNTNAKLMPPLREEKERLKLIRALQNDKIDVITSAHSRKTIEYKDLPFNDAKFGTSTISNFLSIAYTNLVLNEIISMEKLIELICINPAKILGINNKIEVGNKLGLILFDKEYKFKVNDIDSIYHNKELYGRIVEI